MYNEYDEEFYELSEKSMVVDEIVNIAKGLVKQKIKNKIDKLEAENRKLRADLSIYKDFKNERDILNNKIFNLENQVIEAEKKGYEDCRKKRIDQILNIERGYAISYVLDYASPKCDKCDEKRKIHFTSPSGKELTEDCSCAKKEYKFRVAETPMESVIFGHNQSEEFPSRYYRNVAVEEYGKEVAFEKRGSKIWVYEKFADSENLVLGARKDGDVDHKYDFRSYVFADRESAQKYADWLNENYNDWLHKKGF